MRFTSRALAFGRVRAAAAVLLLSTSGGALVAQAPARPPVDELGAALQRKYDTIADFTCDFVHTYEGGVLRKQVTEHGKLVIKKPGRMRWTYATPNAKVFVSDGVKLYSYLPQDKQVIVGTVPPADQATTPVMFLAGKGRLTRDFTVTYDDTVSAPADLYRLRLTPKRAEREYDWLVLEVDRQSLSLRGLTTVDTQGGRSVFTFRNMKENVGVSDKDFTFTIPRGVDVITDGPRS